MKPRIFLDIEKTLIKSLDNPLMINHELIANITKDNPNVSLFTFGIWDEIELKRVEWLIREIGTIHNIKIDEVFTKKTILECVNTTLKITIDEFDLNDFFGKDGAFVNFCKSSFSGECILVDDMVENCIMEFPDIDLKIKMIKC